MGDEDPGVCAFDGFLPVLCQSSASPEPGEDALDAPSTVQDLEAFHGVGALDDLDRPVAVLGKRTLEFGAGVGAIGEDVAWRRARNTSGAPGPECGRYGPPRRPAGQVCR